MKKIILFALSLCVLSCTKQIPETSFEPTSGNYVIYASTESKEAKVSIESSDNTTFNHVWDESDQITVFDGTTNKQFTISEGQGTGSASFTGTELETEAPFYAVYPYTAENSINGSTITVNYPATQIYRSGNYAAGSNVMIGKSTDGRKFNFKNACAYLQLNFDEQSGTIIKSIEISATGGEVIAGTAEVTVDDSGDITAVTMTGSGKIITIECADGLDLTTAQSIYVPIPAVSLTSGFQVVVRAADYTSMGLKSNTVLSKNKVTKMPSISYNGTWTAYGRANCILAYGKTALNIDVTAHPVTYKAVNPEASQGGYRKNNVSQFKVETVPATAEIVWKEDGLTTLDVTSAITDNTVEITNITGFGNALIAIKDANGTILWNFVIWKPVMDPIGENESNLLPLLGNIKMMKPFLGAMQYYTNENYDVVAGDEGLYYQYGRVEPISRTLCGTKLNNASYRIAYSSLVSDITSYKDDAAIIASRKNPDHIIKEWTTSYPQIWHRGGKSYLDPCPEGYSLLITNDLDNATKGVNKIYTLTVLSDGSEYGMLWQNSSNEGVLFDKVLKMIENFKGSYKANKYSYWWTGTYGYQTTNYPVSKLTTTDFYKNSSCSPDYAAYVRCVKK